MHQRIHYISIIFLLKFSQCVWSSYHEIPCNSVYKPANCENASIDTLQTVEDFERCAPLKLDIQVRDYIYGGAGRRITVRENQNAFETIRIRKRVLRDLTGHTLETTVLGRKIPFPIAISPTSGQAFLSPGKEATMAKGAASMGTIMVLTDYSKMSLEDVAASVPPDTNLWMETNLFPNKSSTIDLIRRAEKAGYKAIVVASDVGVKGTWYCINYDDYLHRDANLPNMIGRVEEDASVSVTYAGLKWLTQQTYLPIVVKGILSGKDAADAARAGAAAIYVSNHGGRRLDGSSPSIDVLSEVVDAVREVNPNVEVYLDSGVRNGFDVFKALARGARAVFVGRASLWGIIMGGEEGLKKVLTILRDEFEEAMLHAGFSRPSQITRDSIVPQTPSENCGSRYPLI